MVIRYNAYNVIYKDFYILKRLMYHSPVHLQ